MSIYETAKKIRVLEDEIIAYRYNEYDGAMSYDERMKAIQDKQSQLISQHALLLALVEEQEELKRSA